MACASCGTQACRCDSTVLEGAAINRTLVASLGPVVDCVRDMYTTLGARPYQVMLVWTAWSGGKRGRGVECVYREEAVLPTPQISDISDLSRELSAVGVDESGSVRVSQISTKYTEDYLIGRSDDGSKIPEDQNFYWEIRFPRADGKGPRRRFIPQAAPTLDAMAFQWKISLLKVSEDRMRDGDVRG